MQTRAEVWSHIGRAAPIVVSPLSAEDQRALIFNYRLTHREPFEWLEGKEALNQQLFLYIYSAAAANPETTEERCKVAIN